MGRERVAVDRCDLRSGDVDRRPEIFPGLADLLRSARKQIANIKFQVASECRHVVDKMMGAEGRQELAELGRVLGQQPRRKDGGEWPSS